jgi:hypothetical protein
MVDFSKYEGLGNDFILVDDRDKTAPSLTPEQSAALCHRNLYVLFLVLVFSLYYAILSIIFERFSRLDYARNHPPDSF